jgi:hypothetical protein
MLSAAPPDARCAANRVKRLHTHLNQIAVSKLFGNAVVRPACWSCAAQTRNHWRRATHAPQAPSQIPTLTPRPGCRGSTHRLLALFPDNRAALVPSLPASRTARPGGRRPARPQGGRSVQSPSPRPVVVEWSACPTSTRVSPKPIQRRVQQIADRLSCAPGPASARCSTRTADVAFPDAAQVLEVGCGSGASRGSRRWSGAARSPSTRRRF